MSERAKTRIALLIPSLLPVGGTEQQMLIKAEELIRRGFDVDLLLVDERNDLTQEVPSGVRVFNFRAPRLRYSVGAIARYLRDEAPCAMHAAMWPLTSIAIVARLLARSGTRLLVSDHNPLGLSAAEFGPAYRAGMRASIRATYRFADVRVAVSSGIAVELAAISGLPRSAFSVVHNFAPTLARRDDASHAADDAWGHGGGRRLLTVGRLKAVKNHRLLLDAFQRLPAAEDARLVILGTGELQDALSRYVVDHGLSGRVFLPGHAEDPNPYYRAADLFVLTSDYEGFGNVLLEALAHGLPVISTDCPTGPREILDGGRYGRLVPPGDAEALAAAIRDGLHADHDPSHSRARSEDFSMARVLDQYLDLMVPHWRGGRAA